MMFSSSQRVIVINGVRYNVAIRLDRNWRYVAEWSNDREAINTIRDAGLSQEPWLYVERATPEAEESFAEAEKH